MNEIVTNSLLLKSFFDCDFKYFPLSFFCGRPIVISISRVYQKQDAHNQSGTLFLWMTTKPSTFKFSIVNELFK